MKIGIVGLPNVGKSTLFKALTKIQVDINNYPFCTIEPNVGVVEVPDERVDKLAKISKSARKIYATIEFVDIAGLVEGASKGQGLGNKFLHHIREVDAIVQVVREFESKNITHIKGKINPKEDIETINTELILADIETTEKRLMRLSKEVRSLDKEKIKQKELVEKLRAILDKNSLTDIQLFIRSLKEADFKLIADLHLLSFKPVLYAFNTHTPCSADEIIKKHQLEIDSANCIALNIKEEEEILELTDEEKKELMLKSNLQELIQKSYQLLGLISFLTTGEKETRAWVIPKGSTAPRAGRAIHSDFEEKFIRSDVIFWEKLLEAGSWSKARQLGWVRSEGKDYIVKNGDVIEFKI